MDDHIADEQGQQGQDERHIPLFMTNPENRAIAMNGEKPDHSSLGATKAYRWFAVL
jgi:hypothetical protein